MFTSSEDAGKQGSEYTQQEKMDDERDAESQGSNFAPLSLSCWMMRSLWQQGVSEDRHLRVGIADTVLLEDGHLVCWYFTSSKSGLVLKVGYFCLQ